MKIDLARQYFTDAYTAERDAIFKFCLLRTSDRDTAHDFTQDVFLRFWKALKEDQVIKSSRNFLFTIARNIIIDWYRKKKTLSLDAILEEGGDDKTLVAAAHRDVSETNAEVSNLLRKLDTLDEPYRKAVYLRYVEGFKPREIAAILDESSNVVSVRITRGAEKLRSLLKYSAGL